MGEVDTGKDNLTDPQTVTTDDLKGPEDEGSLASILEKTQPVVFEGHPAMGESETPEGEGEQPKGKGEGEGEQPKGEGEGEQTKGEQEEIPEGWEFKPKYKDHKAAELGAREHQRKVTEATEETKREREAREALERERDELRQQLAEKEGKPAEQTQTPEELEAEQESRIEQALDEIGQLAEDDPDYKKKVAKAWRKAGIGGAGQPAIPDQKALAELIDRKVEERLQARETAKEAETKEEKEANTRTKAAELAGDAGLNMEKGSLDYDLFWLQAGRIPKDLDDKPLSEQVKWCVDEVRRRKGEVVQGKEVVAARARETQVNNTVLGRGSERPKKQAAPDPYTLGSIMNRHMETRRI